MVDERVTDGRRIGELLASELTGLETGPLAAVTLVDVDADAEATADGTRAYRLAYRGDPVAAVTLFPDAVEIRFASSATDDLDPATAIARTREDVRVRSGADGPIVTVRSGAAVKPAVDVVRAVLRGLDGGEGGE